MTNVLSSVDTGILIDFLRDPTHVRSKFQASDIHTAVFCLSNYVTLIAVLRMQFNVIACQESSRQISRLSIVLQAE